ncbi:hypothetical protein [Nocardia sp. NPDC019395]|uniref:hypothetical protein n=1 Tax=Nocardia sp. NPDC019395 TaxID=3154686 RepID=UPI0033C3FE4B
MSTTIRPTAEDALWAVIDTEPRPATELATAAGISPSKTRKILNQWAADGSITRHADEDPRAAARWSITTDHSSDSTIISESEPATTQADAPSQPEAATSEPELTPPPDPIDTNPEPDTVVAEAPGEQDPESAAESTNQSDPDQDKLAPGALRGLVEDHLRDHPGQEFTPHQIGKALAGRSSGAVHNALMKLTQTGVAKQTCDRPKKFALARDTQ